MVKKSASVFIDVIFDVRHAISKLFQFLCCHQNSSCKDALSVMAKRNVSKSIRLNECVLLNGILLIFDQTCHVTYINFVDHGHWPRAEEGKVVVIEADGLRYVENYLSIVCFSFSPSGKLVQIEYALAAVGAGAPSVGIKGKSNYTAESGLESMGYQSIAITD